MIQTKLVSEGRRQNRVSQLFFLTTGFTGGIRIEFFFGVVGAPSLTRRKNEPIAHIRHFLGPALIQLGLTFPTVEAIDQPPNLQKLVLGIKLVIAVRQRAAQALPQFPLKLANLRVVGAIAHQRNVRPRIILNRLQRVIVATLSSISCRSLSSQP